MTEIMQNRAAPTPQMSDPATWGVPLPTVMVPYIDTSKPTPNIHEEFHIPNPDEFHRNATGKLVKKKMTQKEKGYENKHQKNN